MNDTLETLLVKLAIKRVGVDRKVDGEDLTEVTGGRTLDPAFFRASKKLWACEEYDACNAVCNEARAVLGKRAVPAPFIGKGFSLLRADRYPLVDGELRSKRLDLGEAVDRFLAVFPERVAASQAELSRNGIPWTASEYPTEDEVRQGFAIQWQPMEFGVPQALQRIDGQAYAEAERKWQAQMDSAMQEVERVLAGELKALLDTMAERLTPSEDGKRKVFRDSLVGNLREFLREVPFRNVCDSPELAALCREADRVLGNETADSLRASPGMRDMVRTGMARVATALDQAIITAPSRKIVRLEPQVPLALVPEGEEVSIAV